MPAKQLIAVTGGAFVTVSASIYSIYAEIQEDGSGSAAGLKVSFPDDNFTAVYEYPPAQQPIKFGTERRTGKSGSAPLLGKPQRTIPQSNAAGNAYQNLTEAATIYCKVESMGANTVIRVDERP